MEEMLVNAKFKAGNVKKLVNQQATKAAIVSAFKSLASQSSVGIGCMYISQGMVNR